MPYNANCSLWPNGSESYFRERKFDAVRQQGPHCVSTVLAILSGSPASTFQGKVNTQDPVSWSESLRAYGMKLAYCPSDARKIKHYLPELIAMDDLFTLSYYTSTDHAAILGDPDARGWVTGSHIVVLHRDRILDPATGSVTDARTHMCGERHTKRIFRVVPDHHARGL